MSKAKAAIQADGDVWLDLALSGTVYRVDFPNSSFTGYKELGLASGQRHIYPPDGDRVTIWSFFFSFPSKVGAHSIIDLDFGGSLNSLADGKHYSFVSGIIEVQEYTSPHGPARFKLLDIVAETADQASTIRIPNGAGYFPQSRR